MATGGPSQLLQARLLSAKVTKGLESTVVAGKGKHDYSIHIEINNDVVKKSPLLTHASRDADAFSLEVPEHCSELLLSVWDKRLPKDRLLCFGSVSVGNLWRDVENKVHVKLRGSKATGVLELALTPHFESLSQRVKRLATEVDTLERARRDFLEETRRQRKEDLASAEAFRADLVEKTCARLIDDLQISHTSLAKTSSRNRFLESQLLKYKTRIETLSASRAVLKETIANLETVIADLNHKSLQSSSQIAQLQDENAELSANRSSVKRESVVQFLHEQSEMAQELKDCGKCLNALRAEFEGAFSDYIVDISAQSSQKVLSPPDKADKISSEADLQELREENVKLEETLSLKVQELEEKSREFSELEEKYLDMEDSMAELRELYARSQELNEKTHKKLQRSISACSEYESTKDNLQRQIQDAKREIQNIHCDLKQSNDVNKSLRNKISQLEATLQSTTERLGAAEKEVVQTKSELSTLKIQLHDVEELKEALAIRLKETADEKNAMESDFSTMKLILDDEKSNLEFLVTEENAERNFALESENARLRALMGQTSQMDTALSSIRNIVEKLSNEKLTLVLRPWSFEATIITLETGNQGLVDAARELEEMLL